MPGEFAAASAGNRSHDPCRRVAPQDCFTATTLRTAVPAGKTLQNPNIAGLVRHRRDETSPVRRQTASIAKCLGVDPRTVAHIARMETAGLISGEDRFTKRKFGAEAANKDHFDGLIKAATPYAQEFIRQREKQRTENGDRRRR